jgi:hypothetical protein
VRHVLPIFDVLTYVFGGFHMSTWKLQIGLKGVLLALTSFLCHPRQESIYIYLRRGKIVIDSRS